MNSILPLLVFFLVQSALAETKSYLVQFPAGHVVNFPKGGKDPETKKDSLTSSKFIITHTEGKSESSIKGVGGANESYKAPLIRIGNDRNVLNFLEAYPSSVMIWTIWLNNSTSSDNPKLKRAAVSMHKTSILIGERVGTYWGTAIDVDDALNQGAANPLKKDAGFTVPKLPF